MAKSKTKDVVAGLGEIGEPVLQLLSKGTATLGYDKNLKLYKKTPKNYNHLSVSTASPSDP